LKPLLLSLYLYSWPRIRVMGRDSCIDLGTMSIVCLCIFLTLFLNFFLPCFLFPYAFFFLFIYFLSGLLPGWEERLRNDIFCVGWDVKS